MEHVQTTYSGGMNMDFEATKIQSDQYPLLVNGRNRYGIIEPIKMPLRITNGLPASGKMQGLYASDNWMLVFVAGKAYLKDFSTANPFFQVVGFQMDANVDTIYACPVPASSLSFGRKLTTGTNKDVTLTSSISGNALCIVCQDGVNQPWIINSDGSARVTKTYLQWTITTDQEYVPIGKQMLYAGSILYIVAKDLAGKYTQIYRSVSGRPLDFMVNIDTNGNRLPTEVEGGASSVSHRVSYDEITAITDSDVSSGAFTVFTLKATIMVTPDLTNTIFGEPTFTNITTMVTGVVNQFSIVDINNDTGFIDQTGVKSFNSVMQFMTESNSLPFSSPVSPLFKVPGSQDNIIQSVCCAHSSNNYVFFSVDTVYGPAVVVYDVLREVFTGIDIYGAYKVVKFAEVKIAGSRYLYFITDTNELYEAFGSTVTAQCQVYLGEYCSNDPKICQKPQSISLCFTNVYETGTVSVGLYVDQMFQKTETQQLVTVSGVPVRPIPVPFPVFTGPKSMALLFKYQDVSVTGWKAGYLVSWNFNAALAISHAISKDDASMIPFSQQTNINNNYTPKVSSPIFI